jgi:nuclear GTP-binding protein
MPKKSSKSRSKRTTLHQKYKVLKKVKEHHRKKAKELRKKGGRVKPPKDPGIPNAWPFKEQLVKELQFERERAEAAKAARKEAAKERRVRALSPPRAATRAGDCSRAAAVARAAAARLATRCPR